MSTNITNLSNTSIFCIPRNLFEPFCTETNLFNPVFFQMNIKYYLNNNLLFYINSNLNIMKYIKNQFHKLLSKHTEVVYYIEFV